MLDISKLDVPLPRIQPPLYTWTSKDGSKVSTYTLAQVKYIFGHKVAYDLLQGWKQSHTTMNGGTLVLKQDVKDERETVEDTPLALDSDA